MAFPRLLSASLSPKFFKAIFSSQMTFRHFLHSRSTDFIYLIFLGPRWNVSLGMGMWLSKAWSDSEDRNLEAITDSHPQALQFISKGAKLRVSQQTLPIGPIPWILLIPSLGGGPHWTNLAPVVGGGDTCLMQCPKLPKLIHCSQALVCELPICHFGAQ